MAAKRRRGTQSSGVVATLHARGGLVGTMAANAARPRMAGHIAGHGSLLGGLVIEQGHAKYGTYTILYSTDPQEATQPVMANLATAAGAGAASWQRISCRYFALIASGSKAVAHSAAVPVHELRLSVCEVGVHR